MEWSDWNSTDLYLPREVHADRTVAAKFTGFLLEWQKGVTSLITNAGKLEEFLLTVGLVYRDLVAIQSANNPQYPLPDYMASTCSVLTPRLMAVCDRIIHLTKEELERSTIHHDTVHTSTPQRKGRLAQTTKGRKKNMREVEVTHVSQSNAGGGGSRPMESRAEDTPIILPKPRKRVRNTDEVCDLDSDLVGYNSSSLGFQPILTLYGRTSSLNELAYSPTSRNLPKSGKAAEVGSLERSMKTFSQQSL